jgi:IS4 transposase
LSINHKISRSTDSTTITLFSEILKGTGKPCYTDGRAKGGAKVHAVMNVEEGIPCMLKFSKAATSDVKFMDMAEKLPKGSVIAMDKGYSDHKVFIGKKSFKRFVFLSNNFKLSAKTIAGIYRNRWQIELLFKRIKQNFPLKYFYGESVNAITSQIWVVLIACLLLAILHRETNRAKKNKLAFASVVSLVRGLLMSYANIHCILSDPDAFVKIAFRRPPPEENLFSLAGIKM